MKSQADTAARRRALRQQVANLLRSGVQTIPVARTDLAAHGELNEPLEAAPASLFEAQAPGPAALPVADAAAALSLLNEHQVTPCTRCVELAATRTQTVFGVGNPRARLCFLGEAPGADEDRLGEPFVGRAGQLLTRIIEACTFRREDVYILNVIKCRPPGNRNPTIDEVGNCRGFFEQQLAIIQPEFMVCLGAVAATNLLETKQPLGRLRGRFHEWRGIRVMVTYHPAYLLRNPAAKADVWRDMQALLKEMGIDVPKR